MHNKLKKRIDWALDKLNDITLGAYGLLTGEKWLKLVTIGINLPEGAQLVGLTVILVAVWVTIGYLKGQMEE